MSDYVHVMYPWDDLQSAGQYIMVGSYPDYTERMLSSHPPPPALLPTDGSDYDPYSERRAGGRLSDCIGLWMFENEDRASLMETLTR
jgi:hypothetical protein